MLETLASRALAGPIADASISEGLLVDTDLCLPMVVGDNAVGVVGVPIPVPAPHVTERVGLVLPVVVVQRQSHLLQVV